MTNVRGEATGRELREAGVSVRVVADQMAVTGDSPGGLGVRFGPAALEEERRPNAGAGESVEERLGVAEGRWTVRVFGIERQGDSERVYFSTPVMTIPLVKTRWKMTKSMTGMSRVIIVPAWM